MRAIALSGAVLAALLLTGCSASVGEDGGEVSASELAEKVADKQQEENPDKKIDDVECDGGLEAKEGEEQRCHATDALGDRYGLTVRVTGVDDDKISFRTDPDPGQTVEPDELEPEVTTQLTKLSGGTAPDAVDCPDELAGRVGATTTCVLTAGEDRLEVTVTVTSAQGPQVGFDIQVADEPLS